MYGGVLAVDEDIKGVAVAEVVGGPDGEEDEFVGFDDEGAGAKAEVAHVLVGDLMRPLANRLCDFIAGTHTSI